MTVSVNSSEYRAYRDKLFQKRLRAGMVIFGGASLNGLFTAPPKPFLEGPTQLVLGLADVLAGAAIYYAYFGDIVTEETFVKRLRDMGIVTIGASGTLYLTAKGATAAMSEFSNFAGPAGWTGAGVLSFGVTAIVLLAWAAVCDHWYQEDVDPTRLA